jgi:hypothetical protein
MLALIYMGQHVIHVHPDIIVQMESINIYVHLVKVHQVGDIVPVLFVLLDIIHHMLDQIIVHYVHKVISVPDEIKTQFHAVLDKYLIQDI